MSETVLQAETAADYDETAARRSETAAADAESVTDVEPAADAESAADATGVVDDTVLPSTRVVEAVADALGTDPLTMAPLYDVIDPDALDALVDSAMDGHVSFEFCERIVTVHGDGRVAVGSQEER